MAYRKTSKGYRVYICALKKIVGHKDVKIEEERALRKFGNINCSTVEVQEKQAQRLSQRRFLWLQSCRLVSKASRPSRDQEEEQGIPHTQPQTPSIGRKQAKWAEQTLREAQEYVGASRYSVRLSKGFDVHGRDSHVCKLNRALYGLKQSPWAWYMQIDNYLQSMGFTKSEADPNLYYIQLKGEPLILVLYVDDLFLIGFEELITHCKQDLIEAFKTKVLETLRGGWISISLFLTN